MNEINDRKVSRRITDAVDRLRNDTDLAAATETGGGCVIVVLGHFDAVVAATDANLFVALVFDGDCDIAHVRADLQRVRLAAERHRADHLLRCDIEDDQLATDVDKVIAGIDGNQGEVVRENINRCGLGTITKIENAEAPGPGRPGDIDEADGSGRRIRINQRPAVLCRGDDFRDGFVIAIVAIGVVRESCDLVERAIAPMPRTPVEPAVGEGSRRKK